jgi:hypothetical protein
MRFYNGKHIVKHEVIDGNTIETYIAYKDGVVYLQMYINFVLNSETCIANLNTDRKE